MSSLLKDIYSPIFYDTFATTLQEVLPDFDKKKFHKQIFDHQWESLALKERMKHTTLVLNFYLPSDFKKAARLIVKIIESLRSRKINESSLEYMFLADYVETYGINDYNTSVKLMETVTQFTSCEFAVRQFIIKYSDQMLAQMRVWSLHKSHHVRRLASEGSRPRLPWAIGLPALKINPMPILPILENLKNDPSEYVRRSVANNLNDISKDHPDILLSIAKKWKGQSKETDALIKHAARTLLKQGNPSILKHFGLVDISNMIKSQFVVHTPKVKLGDSLSFSFTIHNLNKKPLNIRMEYGIHYLRNNGSHSKKVFKISERQIGANEIIEVERKQSFKLITTRKFYPGLQRVTLIINGQEMGTADFVLAG